MAPSRGSDGTVVMAMGNLDQTGSCSTLPAFLSSTYHLIQPRTGIVASYLAELRLPTDESHCIRNKGQKVPLGLSGPWVV